MFFRREKKLDNKIDWSKYPSVEYKNGRDVLCKYYLVDNKWKYKEKGVWMEVDEEKWSELDDLLSKKTNPTQQAKKIEAKDTDGLEKRKNELENELRKKWWITKLIGENRRKKIEVEGLKQEIEWRRDRGEKESAHFMKNLNNIRTKQNEEENKSFKNLSAAPEREKLETLKKFLRQFKENEDLRNKIEGTDPDSGEKLERIRSSQLVLIGMIEKLGFSEEKINEVIDEMMNKEEKDNNFSKSEDPFKSTSNGSEKLEEKAMEELKNESEISGTQENYSQTGPSLNDEILESSIEPSKMAPKEEVEEKEIEKSAKEEIFEIEDEIEKETNFLKNIIGEKKEGPWVERLSLLEKNPIEYYRKLLNEEKTLNKNKGSERQGKIEKTLKKLEAEETKKGEEITLNFNDIETQEKLKQIQTLEQFNEFLKPYLKNKNLYFYIKRDENHQDIGFGIKDKKNGTEFSWLIDDKIKTKEKIREIADILGTEEAKKFYEDKDKRRENFEKEKIKQEKIKKIEELKRREKELENKIIERNLKIKELLELVESLPDKEFSVEFIEKKIKSLLGLLVKEGKIKKILEDPKVEGIEDKIIITTKIFNSGFMHSENIWIEINLGNDDRGIVCLKDYKIESDKHQEAVKEKLIPELNKIPDLLKSYIEKEIDKEVEKIWIEDGELKVLYKK